jgi:hypothetical protein
LRVRMSICGAGSLTRPRWRITTRHALTRSYGQTKCMVSLIFATVAVT